MGDAAKSLGNKASSTLTAGAFSTSGKGWAQGGSLNDVLKDQTFGLLGGNKIDVPASQARPEFTLGDGKGRLAGDLQLAGWMPESARQSQGVLNDLQSFANTQGPTQQAQYLQEANQNQLNRSLGDAEATGRSQLASANTNMAMRGGLDAGSRERMASSNMLGTMMNKQNARSGAADQNLNILANDEAQKMDVMRSLPSQLLGQAGYETGLKQYDIDNTLNVMGNKYNQDMQAWAGNQAAREQTKLANKNSGLLGLGIGGIL